MCRNKQTDMLIFKASIFLTRKVDKVGIDGCWIGQLSLEKILVTSDDGCNA